jgi:hypothetical protein
MRKLVSVLFLVAGFLCISNPVQASSFYASTDMFSYTGNVTRYATLEDARAGAGSIGGPYTLPSRATDAPYNTPSRDAGIYFVNNAPSYATNANIFLTAWWYTTDAANGAYSGWGNPNNTNTGFVQLYDAAGATSTASNAYFSGWDGAYYTQFNMAVQGQNATYENSYARLWHAPNEGGAGSLTKGVFLDYGLTLTAGGLQGTYDPVTGLVQSTDHPDAVNGLFWAIFQNTNTTDPSLNGYYVANFALGLDNWAYAQGAALNGAFSPSEFGAPVPIPAAVWLLGSGVVGLVALKRRRQK